MSTRSSSLGALKAAGLGLLALGAVLALEQGRAAQSAWRRFDRPLSRGLPQGLTRTSLLAALGDQSRVAADWAYIDCLQYLGDPLNRQDGGFQRTLALYREVLWLDPGFTHAGREGVSVLGWFQNRPAQAAELIQLARAWNPDEPRYGAYLAALAYQERVDIAGVVEALRLEALRPDAPEMLKRMLGNLYLKAGDWEGAQVYWRGLLQRSDDPGTRLMAQRALAKAAAGLRAAASKPLEGNKR